MAYVSPRSPEQIEIDEILEKCLNLDDYYFRCRCLEFVEDMR